MSRFRSLTVLAASAVLLGSGTVAAASQGASAAPASPSGRFLVQFSPGGQAQGVASLKQAGAEVVLNVSHSRIVAVSMPAGSVASLRTRPGINFVEPDPVRHLMSDQIDPNAQITPYGVTMTQADQVHPDNPSNKTVCIIDTGYYLGHEDLPSTNVSGTSLAGPWGEDDWGHGSHVAGIIAAEDNDLGVVGVDPGVGLHIVRVFGSDGAFYASDLIEALGSCETAGADVVNMSLGGAGRSDIEEAAFDTAYNDGILPVAAAGNDGHDPNQDPDYPVLPSYPANYASVVSVGAVDSSQAIADFSQFNPDVELAAPGVDVLSTHPLQVPIATLTSGTNTWSGAPVENTLNSDGVTGSLIDGGSCAAPLPGDAFAGDVVLCNVGTGDTGYFYYSDYIDYVALHGGAAAVLYDPNQSGLFQAYAFGADIPAITLKAADAAQALQSVGVDATVVSGKLSDPNPSGYTALGGTSMATPHVAGIAALIWSAVPNATVSQIRAALDSSALDLGDPGRDEQFGFGLVQARAALDYLIGDNTPPDVQPTLNPATPGSGRWYNTPVTLTWSVVDDESAITSTSGCEQVTVNSNQPLTTYTCTATSAGGTTTQSVSIGYTDQFGGFRAPLPKSKQKSGSSVPVKFKLTDYQGNLVTNATVQVAIGTAVGTGTTTTCAYSTTILAYQCKVKMPSIKTSSATYYLTVSEKIGTSFVQVVDAPTVAGKTNANGEPILVVK